MPSSMFISAKSFFLFSFSRTSNKFCSPQSYFLIKIFSKFTSLQSDQRFFDNCSNKSYSCLFYKFSTIQIFFFQPTVVLDLLRLLEGFLLLSLSRGTLEDFFPKHESSSSSSSLAVMISSASFSQSKTDDYFLNSLGLGFVSLVTGTTNLPPGLIFPILFRYVA